MAIDSRRGSEDAGGGAAAPFALTPVALQRLLYAAAAAVLLVPCFWQSRIHAGDLSSHIYNAWLATLIEKGQAPGLVIKPMFTNVALDLLLERLLKWFGPDWAQRIGAALVVLVFAAGVFAFLNAVSRKPAWFLYPLAAMLSYGWIFHRGFLNDELSLGFSLMALSLLVRPTRGSAAAAAVLLVIAFTAHFMPPLWAAAIASYRWVTRRIRPRRTPILLAASLGALALLGWFLRSQYLTVWPAWQDSLSAGAAWIPGDWLKLLLPLVLAAWGLLFMRLVDAKSPMRLMLSFPAQCLVLNLGAMLLLPDQIFPPGYQMGFEFIRGRFSLLVAIAICALLASARPRLPELALAAVGGCAFFAALFAENRSLNLFEDKLTRLVQTLPPGSRAVARLDPPGRFSQTTHMIDRVCIGHCFSYANYEPTTNHFRIRIHGTSPLVAPDAVSSVALQNGTYLPPRGGPPYYEITLCPGTRDFCVKLIRPPD